MATPEKAPASATSGTPIKTVDLYQKREKIYQRKMSGFFQTLRVLTMWLTLGVYFIGPWLRWDGHQAILFDLPQRKFHIFWMTFWPQDFVFLSWLLIIAAFALFFFTALAGRVWCGYTCPQTVWTTFFMWIEHITEGDRNQRIKLDAQPWSFTKARKKTAKHGLWLLLAFWTAFTFVAYFTPAMTFAVDLATLNVSGWALFWLIFFTVMTYLNAGWMREQVCLYMCPYARFQSVMFDRDTLIVTYDVNRGEPRGSRKKSADPNEAGLGDCINCQMCVQVCPTGIDIREGLQYECISCAACIDACDHVMEQMNYPKGLIRYSTENAVEGQKSHLLRPRLIGYGAVLIVMIVLFIGFMVARAPLALDIIRDRNALFREIYDGSIENSYTLKIMNKTQAEQTYQIAVAGIPGAALTVDSNIHAEAGELLTVPVTVTVPPETLQERNTSIEFTVTASGVDGGEITEESRFLGPRP